MAKHCREWIDAEIEILRVLRAVVAHRYYACEVLLITVEQEGLLESLGYRKVLFVLIGGFLGQSLLEGANLGLKFWGALLDDLVDEEVVLVERHDLRDVLLGQLTEIELADESCVVFKNHGVSHFP